MVDIINLAAVEVDTSKASASIDALVRQIERAQKDIKSIDVGVNLSSNIESVVNSTNSALNSVNRAGQQVGNTLQDTGDRGTRALTRVNNTALGLNRTFTTLLRSALAFAAGFAGAIGTTALVRNVVKVGAQFEDLQSQLESVTGSAREAARTFEFIQNLSLQTPFSVQDLVISFNQLAGSGFLAGKSLEEVDGLFRTLSDGASLALNKVEAFEALTRLLSRSVSGGLGLQQLEQVFNRIPGLQVPLQEALGVDRQGLTELGKTVEGSQKIVQELLKQLQSGQFVGATNRTLENTSTLLSNLGISFDNFLKKIFDADFGDAFKDAIAALTAFINEFDQGAEAIGRSLALIVRGLVSVLPQIEFIVSSVAGLIERFTLLVQFGDQLGGTTGALVAIGANIIFVQKATQLLGTIAGRVFGTFAVLLSGLVLKPFESLGKQTNNLGKQISKVGGISSVFFQTVKNGAGFATGALGLFAGSLVRILGLFTQLIPIAAAFLAIDEATKIARLNTELTKTENLLVGIGDSIDQILGSDISGAKKIDALIDRTELLDKQIAELSAQADDLGILSNTIDTIGTKLGIIDEGRGRTIERNIAQLQRERREIGQVILDLERDLESRGEPLQENIQVSIDVDAVNTATATDKIDNFFKSLRNQIESGKASLANIRAARIPQLIDTETLFGEDVEGELRRIRVGLLSTRQSFEDLVRDIEGVNVSAARAEFNSLLGTIESINLETARVTAANNIAQYIAELQRETSDIGLNTLQREQANAVRRVEADLLLLGVDARERAIELIKQETAAQLQLSAIESASTNFQTKTDALIRQVELNNQLLSLSIAEREIEEALIPLLLEKEAITKRLGDLGTDPNEIARVNAELEKQIEIQRGVLQAQQETQRSFEHGWSEAFKRFVDDADNQAMQAEQLFMGLEGAASSFITGLTRDWATGTKTLGDLFNDLGNRILDILTDIAVKAAIAQVFGTGSGSFGPAAGGGGFDLAGLIGGLFATAKQGGIVGQPMHTRSAPASVFQNAPHFRSGGFPGLRPDEIPIIAHKGEEVLTKDDPRNRLNGRSNMAVPNITFNVSAPSPEGFANSRAEITRQLNSMTMRGMM
jgi:lambda family phage tail tape measure protein